MISIELAGETEQDVVENGPQAVLLRANNPVDRQALAVLVATITAGLSLHEEGTVQ